MSDDITIPKGGAVNLFPESVVTDLAMAGDDLAESIGHLTACLDDPLSFAYDGGTSRAVARQRVERWTALRNTKAPRLEVTHD